MRKLLCIVGLAAVATAATFAQARDGEISGRVADSAGAPLPGVRVTIGSAVEHYETTTDPDGRFAVPGVPSGTYHVSAELAGFITASGTVALTPAIRRVHLAWVLRVGCLVDEGLRVRFTAHDAAPLVDAIVHLRVESDDGPLLWSSRPECDGTLLRSYTVAVLSSALPLPGSDPRPATRQIFTSLRDGRLTAGQEYVALIWPGWRAGDGLVLRVVSGRISQEADDRLGGMRVSDAMAMLAGWAREPRR